MSDASKRPGHSLADLVELMDRLLAPDGCPWDREQTLDSLKPYLIEETFEVLEAIESGKPAAHCEELGDLLLQIVFQAAVRQADGDFAIDDVVAAISEKLIRRHPHVFARDVQDALETAGQVEKRWEEIKKLEQQTNDKDGARAGRRRTLDGVPGAMPALARAQKLTERAAHVGFDWPEVAGCLGKVKEELAEVEAAVAGQNSDAIQNELGDLLFSCVNLARLLHCDAESALRGANRRFCDRFGYIEDRLEERGSSPEQASLEEMDALWNEAKR